MKKIVRTGSLVAAMLLATTAFSQENYTQWTFNRSLQLNTTATGANVATTQLKFPVLVRLGTADSLVFKQSIGKGADIRFAKTNGTRLKHHTELWDSVGRSAAIWVLVDSVKGNSTTLLNLYWGKTGAVDSSKSASVFDTTNAFRAVWNLSDSTGGVSKDATAMNTNAVWMNAPVLANGVIGKAVNFANPNGTTSANGKYLTAAYNVTNNNFKVNSTKGLTLSAWVNRTTNNGQNNQGIAGRWNWNGGDRRQAILEANATVWQYAVSPTGLGSNEATVGRVPVVNGTWAHVAATYRNGAQTLYVNGVADTTLNMTVTGLDSIWAAAPFLIGRMETNNCCLQAIDATIDEVRLSDTTRSAAWLKLEYENQKPAQTLVSTVVAQTAPSNLAYATQNALYTVGTAITTNTPAFSGGPVDSFTVAPNLPAGLVISKTTGAITGTPTAITAAANYVVTARNTLGTALDTISIAVQAAPEDYSTWTYRRKVRLNTTAAAGGAALTANVYNFPVLIRLGQNERDVVTYSKGRGADLRVSKADGVTPLPYQIERWDSAGRKVEIWVLMDTVKANDSAQSIRLFWNKTGVTDRSAGSAVFGTTNGFAGVWHQAPGTNGSTGDATSNMNHALWAGAATSTEGAIGPARLYNAASGGGDFDTVGANQTFNMSANDRVTVSAWVKRLGANASSSTHEGIAGLFDWTRDGAGVNNRSYDLVHNTGDGFTFHVSSTGGDGANEVIASSATLAVDGAWTHVAGTVDGANINVYINGVAAVATPYTGNIHFPSTLAGMGPFTIGRMDDNGGAAQYFNGAIDEVQLSNVARTADWMKLSYANQKPVATMLRHDSTNAPVVALSAAARMTTSAAFNAVKQGNGLVFSLPATGEAGKLSLLDASGRSVWSASVPAGATRFAWNGTSTAGSKLSSGLYTAHYVSNGQSFARRVVRMP